jgi:beta-lactamase superfamily II metal-dependent hydrolase
VGHGDSIVLEHEDCTGEKSFGVIDSNCKPGASPRALDLLKSLGAEKLSFVAITHPHADHYMGMKAILQHFSTKIDVLYTFPIRKESGDMKRLVKAYKDHATSTDDKSQQKNSLELAHILLLAKSAATYWETPSGTKTDVSVSGFVGVKISTLLPPSKVKGDFFQKILSGEVEPETLQLNDLSMAFLVEYAGQQIILAGDGTQSNWMFQAKRWEMGGQTLAPVAVKVPHHGSKHDCSPKVINILYGVDVAQAAGAVACVSANGKTHPSPDVLDEFVRRGILPYCTNLARRCGANTRSLIADPQTDPTLLRLINSAAIDSEESTQPCQGDIVLEFQSGHVMRVTTEHKNLCPLRGDLSFLSGSVH